MRGFLLEVLTLLVLNSAARLQAGIYQTVEPVRQPTATRAGAAPLPFKILREDVVQGLAVIPRGDLPKNELRQRYLRRRDELLQKERAGRASEEDLVNLSACLIRLNEPKK